VESVAISKPPDAFVILDAPSQQILCSVLALDFVKYFKGTPRFRVLHVLPYPLSLGDNLGGKSFERRGSNQQIFDPRLGQGATPALTHRRPWVRLYRYCGSPLPPRTSRAKNEPTASAESWRAVLAAVAAVPAADHLGTRIVFIEIAISETQTRDRSAKAAIVDFFHAKARL
jgi:hypothetical protein